jgi:hypothetical protein
MIKNDDDIDQAADPSWRVIPFIGWLPEREQITDSLLVRLDSLSGNHPTKGITLQEGSAA